MTPEQNKPLDSTTSDHPPKADSPDRESDSSAASAVRMTAQDGNDERGTPSELIRTLTRALGSLFDLDPCSGAEPRPIAETRFTKADDGLNQDWRGHDTVFVNPPYSDLDSWLEKVHMEATRDHPDAPGLIICLLPAYTTSAWFQDYASQSDYLVLLEQRLSFYGTDKDAPFPSLLAVFGDVSESMQTTFDRLGVSYTRAALEEAVTQDRLPSPEPAADDTTTGDDAPSIDARDGATSPPSPGGRDGTATAAPAEDPGVDFYKVALGDRLTIEFDRAPPGHPAAVPPTAEVEVIGGQAAGERADSTHSLLCIGIQTEIYYLLQQDPAHGHVRGSAAVDGGRWKIVRVTSLQHDPTGTRPAIDPYGPETSYVC